MTSYLKCKSWVHKATNPAASRSRILISSPQSPEKYSPQTLRAILDKYAPDCQAHFFGEVVFFSPIISCRSFDLRFVWVVKGRIPWSGSPSQIHLRGRTCWTCAKWAVPNNIHSPFNLSISISLEEIAWVYERSSGSLVIPFEFSLYLSVQCSSLSSQCHHGLTWT